MTSEDRIVEVKRKAEAELLRLPGVHAVGVGAKFVKGERTGELVIQVFVMQKRPLADLREAERIPAEIDGFKTDVIESKPAIITAEDARGYRPLYGGTQISVPAPIDQTAVGTLGCIAATNAGEAVALSNYHVLFSAPSKEGSNVWQPVNNGCDECCSNVIGTVLCGDLTDDVDAGLVTLKPGTQWMAEVIDIGVISGTCTVSPEDAKAGYEVRKRGRTTSLTAGSVFSVEKSGKAVDAAGVVVRNYKNEMEIAPHPVFSSDDFLDSQELVKKLRASADLVSQYVWSQFAEADKMALAEGIAAARRHRSTLASALNGVLRGGSIYDASRFAGVSLSSETELLRSKHPAGADLIRLNRMLLEDAFRDEIKPVHLFPTDGASDFASIASLVKKLQDSANPVSAYLWGRVSAADRAVLSDPQRTAEWTSAMVFALNKILRGVSIYEAARFANVKLSAETVALESRAPTGTGLIRLNRRLLEEAYPEEIAARPSFSLQGDSGAVVVDDAGNVVALLWGGDLSTGSGMATPIGKVEAALQIKISTATQAGIIQTVPGGSAQEAQAPGLVSGGAVVHLVTLGNAGEVKPLRSVSFASERLDTLMRLGFDAHRWLRHVDEVRALLMANRRVAVAWRRGQVQELYRYLMGEQTRASESELNRWTEALTPFVAQLRRYGSAALCADIAELMRALALLEMQSSGSGRA